jgi:hypothetical protein
MKLGKNWYNEIRNTAKLSPIRRYYVLNNLKVCLTDTLNVICPNNIDYWDFCLDDVRNFEKILESYDKSEFSKHNKEVVICELICNKKFQNGKELTRGVGFVFFAYSEYAKKPMVYSFILPYSDLTSSSVDFYDDLLDIIFLFVKDTTKDRNIESKNIEDVLNRYIHGMKIALEFCNYQVKFYTKFNDDVVDLEDSRSRSLDYGLVKIRLNDNEEFEVNCNRPLVYLPFFTNLTVVET